MAGSLVFKRVAVHNLRVTSTAPSGGIFDEGVRLPRELMAACGILPFEQIVVTNMRGRNWDNRVCSFAVPGDGGQVEGLGSAARLILPGDLVCVIARGHLDSEGLRERERGALPCIDVGFSPGHNHDNELGRAEFLLEHADGRKQRVTAVPDEVRRLQGARFSGLHLSRVVVGLEVTQTHPDCLQGSAELPAELMQAVGLLRYQGVLVYNVDAGGMAETYAVPTEPGVVMTTGAMAGFAPEGTRTSVAAFALGAGDPPVALRVRRNSAALAERRVLVDRDPQGDPVTG